MDPKTRDRRYETCTRCGKSWNVSREHKTPLSGYLCPVCVAADKRIERALDRAKARRIGLLCIVLYLDVLASIWARHAAVVARGNTAWGGEALVPLLPLIGWACWRTVRDWREELRKCR